MISKDLKLSIIIPNYNSGSTLEQTLGSILNQKYTNLELIVIDGNSTDNSIEVIKKYEPYLYYWVSEKDNGQAHAINKGLKVATGEYIAYMNADDLYLDGAFNQINSIGKKYKYDFIFGNVKSGENLQDAITIQNSFSTLALDKLLLFFFNVRFIVPSQSVWINMAFLRKNQLDTLDETLNYCMDLEWYCRISMFDPKTYKIEIPNSFFRLAGNTKTLKNSKAMKEESLQVAYKYLKLLNLNQINNWYKHLLLDKILRRIYNKKIENRLGVHFWLIRKTGIIALFDKRFLGLLKSSI
jgi:glycosyltransferase involved in cell wall biosynthesis